MSNCISTYPFKPISNKDQNIHVISITERIKKSNGSVLITHRTDFYIMLIVTSSCSVHIVDFKEIELNTGDVLFLNPDMVHCFKENEKYDGILVAFTKDFYCNSLSDADFLEKACIFNHLGSINKLTFDTTDFKLITHVVTKLKDELNRPHDNFQKQLLHNHLSNLLLLSERKASKELIIPPNTSKDYKCAQSFKKLVAKKIIQYKKVKDYADELLISERHLQRAVEKTMGKPPKTIIIEYLILESKRLLIYELMSIKEVSYYLGFDEPSNFTKFFKKYTGTSPSKFKAKQDFERL